MVIGIAGWAVLGIIVGFVTSKLVNLHGDDPRMGIGLAALGAVIGGWLYSWISGSTVSAFNLWSLVVAGICASIALATWHFVRSRGTYERPTIRRSY